MGGGGGGMGRILRVTAKTDPVEDRVAYTWQY